MTIGVWIALVGVITTWLVTLAGVIVWAIRLEGKFNTKIEVIQARHDALAELHQTLKSDLCERIDNGFSKLDRDIQAIFSRLNKM